MAVTTEVQIGARFKTGDVCPVSGRYRFDGYLDGTLAAEAALKGDPELLFAATTGAEVWHVFRFDLATRQLAQLTDGPDDDFDPCPLPSGRVAFTSTRRGGVGRCVLTPQSLTYTLHSMEPDGSDIVCLSFHETNEWDPVVTNDGRKLYATYHFDNRIRLLHKVGDQVGLVLRFANSFDGTLSALGELRAKLLRLLCAGVAIGHVHIRQPHRRRLRLGALLRRPARLRRGAEAGAG